MDRADANPGVDRISNLADPILSQIVSQLPVEEAIRTTVLGKRWRPIWKDMPCLDFNAPKMLRSLIEVFGPGEQVVLPDNIEEYIGPTDSHVVNEIIRSNGLITPILQSHQTNLTKCRIVHFASSNYVSQVNEWVEILLNRKFVETLILTCERLGCRIKVDDQGLDLPSGIFSVNTVRALELTKYKLDDVSPFIGCDSLCTLKLNGVLLDDNTLTAIVSSCRLLKELRLISCEGYKELVIDHSKLEFLELRCLVTYKINIHAEALNVLILDSVRCAQNYAFIHAPLVTEFRAYITSTRNLVNASVESSYTCYLEPDNLLARCSGLLQPQDMSSIITRTNYVSTFVNLQFLYTCLDLNNIRETIIFAFLFGTCTRLRKLIIVIQNPGPDDEDEYGDSSFLYPEHMYWDKKEIFDSISNSLKEVVLGAYRGRVLELGLVQYLITRALKMEKITIGFDDKCTKEAVIASKTNILLLPRASSNLSIVLEPGCKYSAGVGGSFEDWIDTLH